jgi:hypothetical protein
MNQGKLQRNNLLLKVVQEKEGPFHDLQKTEFLE